MKTWLLTLACLLAMFSAFAQTDREFWFVAPEVTTTHYDFVYYNEYKHEYRGGEPTFLRISTRELASTVTIEMPANTANFPPITVTIPPNSTQSINLTDLVGQDQIENKYQAGGLNNKGIHITSTELITVYYEVATTNNTDLFALKGKNALGTEFYCPFQNVSKNNTNWSLHWKAAQLGEKYPTPAYSAIDIVATHDNTQVWIVPSKRTFENKLPGIPYMITLDEGETYTVGPEAYVPSWYGGQSTFSPYPEDRLAGTKITSNYPIAVTISDDSMKFPSNGCYDLFGDQLVPTDIIGYEYIALRGQLDMSGRAAGMSGEQLYILATKNATKIYIGGVLKTILNEGQTYFYEFADSDYAVHITSDEDHPFYVLHISGFGCEMGGAFLPPTSACTGSTQIGFTRSTTAGFFLNLMVRKDAFDGFLLNGTPILTNLSDWTAIPTDPNWVATIVDLTSGGLVATNKQSLIVNTKDIFHMGVINGNKTGGCRFGYFSDYNKLVIDAITTNTETGNIRTCWGEPVRLEAEGGTNFHWTPHDFLDDPYSQNPLSKPRGNIKYTVSVSGACDMVGTADVTIEVAPRVESVFTVDTTEACAPYEFTFYNSSAGATDENKWDFGDGMPASNISDATVKHEFTNDADSVKKFTVSLVAKNLESCRDTMTRDIFVYPSINAAFSPSITEYCSPVVVNFANSSTGARGDKPHLWEFGDGAASSNESPSHSFNNMGTDDTTYTVQLVASNQYYCSDTVTAGILVHPYIKADYAVAPIETCTPYNAEISDKSVGTDTYRWSYGDGATSTTSDAVHSHEYKNTTTATKNYQLRLIVDNDEGCSDTLSRKLIIHPLINANFALSETVICDNTEIIFTNSSTGASSYFWDFGDQATSIQENPKHTFRNLTNATVVYTVTLVVSASNGVCSDTITKDITVYPYLTAQFNFSPSSGCSPHSVQINNTSEGADTYQWAFGDGQTSKSSQTQLSHTYTNTSLTQKIYTLSLITKNNEGCTRRMDKNITIYPPINADFGLSSDAVCDSGSVSFSNKTTGATAYQWDFGDGSSSSVASPKHVYQNIGATSKIHTVQLIVSANNNACADTATKSVTVHPQIRANFGLDKSADCTPFTVTANDASLQANTYTWTISDGTVLNTAGNISHEFVNTNNAPLHHTIQLKVANTQGCSSSLVKKVTIYPKVTANFTPTNGCSPHTITNFNNTSVNASLYRWDFGDNTSSNEAMPEHTFKNFSTTADADFAVTLTAESQYGCSDTKTANVTAFYSPKAEFSIGEATGCSPYDITISNNTEGGISYLWDFGDGRPTQTWGTAMFSVTYTNDGRDIQTFPITLEATSNNACVSTITRNVVIYPAITAEFSVSDGCYPHTISNFNNTSVGAVQYNWDFGDGVTSNAQNPIHLFKNFSTTADSVYAVTLQTTSPNGCTATETKAVTVLPKPNASFEISDATGCSPYTVTIANSSKGADSYLWDMADGDLLSTSTTSFNHDYFNSTRNIIKYPVSLIVSNTKGCSDTLIRQAVIYPNIKAEFAIESGCHPHTVANFNNTSVGAVKYDWDFGDQLSSSDKSPAHTFEHFSRTTDTTYKIVLKVESLNGCKASKDTTITIYHKPLAEFDIADNEGCSPHTTQINNQAKGATALQWDFGDSSTGTDLSASFDHTYQNATGTTQIYPLQLVAVSAKNCTDTISRNATIYSDITSRFSAESGCHPLTIASFSNSSVGADSYNWTFGDGQSSNEKDPSHTFNNFSNTANKQFTIALKTQSINGCYAQWDTTITVYPKPLAEFLIVNPEGCSPLTANIEHSSSGADTAYWNFADGSATEQNLSVQLSHLFTNVSGKTQMYPVELLVKTQYGCSDTISRNATIHSEVHARFSIESGCHPLKVVSFNNATIGADNYNWTFGDNQSSNEKDPIHSYSNISNEFDSTYAIHLHAESIYGCKGDADSIITVYHKPVAEFSIDNTPGCSPYPVTFTNKSKGNSQIHWEFGDGTDSLGTNSNMEHIYKNSTGEVVDYPVIVTALTDHNCSDTTERKAKIYPDITAMFAIESGCDPHTIVNFNNTSQWVDDYQWSFGDGGSSNEEHPQHLFKNFTRDANQTFTVSLKTESRYGCKASHDTTITVWYKPKAEFSILNNNGCSPYTIQIAETSSGADTSYWAFGDDSTLAETSMTAIDHLYNNDSSAAKQYPIRLITRTTRGCSDTITRSATIYPNISSEFSAKPSSCSPFRVQFYNDSQGSTTTDWTFGDGSESNEPEPVHTYFNYSNTADSVYTVTLKTESKYGCRAQSEMDITVYSNPKPQFDVLNSPGCSPHTINIDNKTIGADVMLWDFADGTTARDSITEKLNHLYKNAGPDLKEHKIEQIAVTNNGCIDTIVHSAIIYPDITSKFTIDMQGCNPLKVATNNTSKGATLFRWEMGDGNSSNQKDLTHIYYNFDPQTHSEFTVSLKTESKYGCTAFSDTTVAVFAVPVADFSVSKDLGCSPFVIPFKNISQGGSIYAWNFDDGSANATSKSPTHTFKNRTTSNIQRDVKLVVSNLQNCKDSIVKTVTVNPEVLATFSGDLEGCHPHLVEFENNSELADFYTWTLGGNDTRTSDEPFKYFENTTTSPKTISVQLIARSRFDCTDTVVKNVIVYPSPDADFDVTPKKQTFPSSATGKAPVFITDKTNDGEWIYLWNYGDGATSDTQENHTHNYMHWNQSGSHYLITLDVVNSYGCSDTASQKVVVTSPLPEPTFDISSDNGCPPYTVDFKDQSAYGNNVTWNFGDDITSKDRDASHTYLHPGTYNVTFEVEGDGGISSADTTIKIHQTPIVKFEVENPLLNLPNDTLHVKNLSAYGERYLWTFGDEATSEEKEPSHLYEKQGTYSINLAVWTSHDCVADSTAENAVRVQAPCSIVFPNAFTPNPNNSNGGTYKGLEATNDIFFPAVLEEGVEDYHLEVYNKWGEMIFVTDDKAIGWDGYYRNELSKMDTYVWKLKATCADGREILQVGDVTLIR